MKSFYLKTNPKYEENLNEEGQPIDDSMEELFGKEEKYKRQNVVL